MLKKAVAMVVASFAADALAFGVQGVCDFEEIDQRLNGDGLFLKPSNQSNLSNIHGELTDRGTQALLLLRFVASTGGYDPLHFAQAWVAFFNKGPGPVDADTRSALQNLKIGIPPHQSGANSLDIAGVARMAPVVFCHRKDTKACVEACRSQTAMTHKHPDMIIAAEFFGRVAHSLLRANTPQGVIRRVADELFPRGTFRKWITNGLDSTSMDTRLAISAFGQGGMLESIVPSVIHLAAKYENDLVGAMIQNTKAGGDAADRGLLAAMIIGAYGGADSISDWASNLKYGEQITSLLEFEA